jgi:hypothetical protein
VSAAALLLLRRCSQLPSQRLRGRLLAGRCRLCLLAGPPAVELVAGQGSARRGQGRSLSLRRFDPVGTRHGWLPADPFGAWAFTLTAQRMRGASSTFRVHHSFPGWCPGIGWSPCKVAALLFPMDETFHRSVSGLIKIRLMFGNPSSASGEHVAGHG